MIHDLLAAGLLLDPPLSYVTMSIVKQTIYHIIHSYLQLQLIYLEQLIIETATIRIFV